MAAKLTVLDKVSKLDDEILVLHSRLTIKLNERRSLLALAISQGEAVRSDVASEVRSLAQATNLVTRGRILTDEQVREIRRLHSTGVSQGALGRRFGLSQPSIHRIVKRHAYADVA